MYFAGKTHEFCQKKVTSFSGRKTKNAHTNSRKNVLHRVRGFGFGSAKKKSKLFFQEKQQKKNKPGFVCVFCAIRSSKKFARTIRWERIQDHHGRTWRTRLVSTNRKGRMIDHSCYRSVQQKVYIFLKKRLFIHLQLQYAY